MKKQYSFRLDSNLVKKLDGFDGSRTHNLELSIQNYIQMGYDNVYNVDTKAIQVLEDQVSFLKGQVSFLQRENSYLSRSWFVRLLLPRHKNE